MLKKTVKTRKIWQVVGEVTNDHNTQPEIKSRIKFDNMEMTGKKQISDEFNNYFSKKGKKIAHMIKNSVVKKYKEYLSKLITPG